MSIDHVLKFADEAEALMSLPDFCASGQWDTSRVLPNNPPIIADAVWDNSDPENPVLVSPEQTLPGWWITVTLPELSEELTGLAGSACRFAANNETGQIIYTASDVNLALLSTARMRTVWAGSQYNFGG